MGSKVIYSFEFEVLRVVRMSAVDFWVSSCGFVGDYQRFGGTYRLHLQG
jgi:hypothetical protein